MTNSEKRKDPPHGSVEAFPGHAQRRTISSQDIFGADSEVIIVHGGQHYRLRITSKDKLILTK